MTIGVAGYKGGVSKTVCSVHIAGVLSQRETVVLIDTDPNRSATSWSRRGDGFPFSVVTEDQVRHQRTAYMHTIIDTEARPSPEDMRVLAGGCDLLILPTLPDALSLDGLMQTLNHLNGVDNARALVAAAPPGRAGEDVRDMLADAGWPVFRTVIRRFSAYPKAAAVGRLVRDVSDLKAETAWSDYVALVKEIRKHGNKV